MDSFRNDIVKDLATARVKIKSSGSLDASEIQEIDFALKNQIHEAFNLLINSERSEIKSSSDNTSRVLLIILILYVVSLFFFYVSWAIPMASKFNTEVG